MNDAWTVVDDPMFYKGLCQRWQSEVRFQVAKVNRYKRRVEDIRAQLRDLERNGYDDAGKRELHRLVFN